MRVTILRQKRLALALILAWAGPLRGDAPDHQAQYIREHYAKQSYQIPMRAGVHLYTIVYAPKDKSRPYPLMMTRTPYGIHPYDEDKFRASLGPNQHFLMEKYIF